MNISLNKLINRSDQVTVEIPGVGKFDIVYWPTTDTIQKQFDSHRDNKEFSFIDRMAADLSVAIKEWGIVDEQGQPVAPTFEFLRALDIGILQAMSRAITEHMLPPRRASGI